MSSSWPMVLFRPAPAILLIQIQAAHSRLLRPGMGVKMQLRLVLSVPPPDLISFLFCPSPTKNTTQPPQNTIPPPLTLVYLSQHKLTLLRNHCTGLPNSWVSTNVPCSKFVTFGSQHRGPEQPQVWIALLTKFVESHAWKCCINHSMDQCKT